MKKKVLILSILFISLGMLTQTPLEAQAVELFLTSEKSAQFLCDHFSDFKHSINSKYNFAGNSCEQVIPIYSPNDETFSLVDFDGMHGFILLGNNLQSYDFKAEGDFQLVYDKGKKIIFSNGIYFYNDSKPEYEEMIENQSLLAPFQGQSFSGSGGIYAPDTYVIDRYDSHYLLENFDSFYLSPNLQSNFNIYNSPTGGGEGNCTLVASYTALNYIRMTRFYNLPNSYVTYTPSTQETSLYNLYTGQKGYTTSQSSYTFRQLFVQLRNRAIYRGYTPDGGMNIWNSSGIIEDVASAYGYTIDGVELIDYTPNFTTVMTQIGLRKPMLWSTLSDQTYGSHVMVVNGYRQYHKTEQIWFFTNHSYANLLAIYDGWTNSQRYFDITSYAAGYNWGALVRFDYEI